MATTLKPAPRLVCLQCDSTDFVSFEGDVTQEFRGETLVVKVPVMRCTHCGWQTLAPGQLNELRVRTADAYRQKHGLLTSHEIRGRRQARKMSQRQFAADVGVSPASIPRWESWGVQEPVYDAKIRQATEAAAGAAWGGTTWLPIVWHVSGTRPTNLPEEWDHLVAIGAKNLFPAAAINVSRFESIERDLRAQMHVVRWEGASGQRLMAIDLGECGRSTTSPESIRCNKPLHIDASFSLTA